MAGSAHRLAMFPPQVAMALTSAHFGAARSLRLPDQVRGCPCPLRLAVIDRTTLRPRHTQ